MHVGKWSFYTIKWHLLSLETEGLHIHTKTTFNGKTVAMLWRFLRKKWQLFSVMVQTLINYLFEVYYHGSIHKLCNTRGGGDYCILWQQGIEQRSKRCPGFTGDLWSQKELSRPFDHTTPPTEKVFRSIAWASLKRRLVYEASKPHGHTKPHCRN